MPRAGLTPALVVREAALLSDEEGFAALSLSAVAQRLGVATPSLYKHVDGLTGLRREVALLGVSELGECLQRATVGRSGPDALRATAEAYRRYAHVHPGRYAALQRFPLLVGAEAEPDTDPVQAMAAVLRGFGIAEDQMVHAIRVLRSALHGFVDLDTHGGFGLPQDVDETYALLVEGLVRALQQWPDAPERTGTEQSGE